MRSIMASNAHFYIDGTDTWQHSGGVAIVLDMRWTSMQAYQQPIVAVATLTNIHLHNSINYIFNFTHPVTRELIGAFN